MLKKFLMAAGLAAAFSLSAQVAEAKVNVTIGIGQPGGYCYYNYDPFRCGGYGYYPRPGYFVPHPGYGYGDDYGYGTACPAMKPAGLSGSAVFAMCARQIAAASFTPSLPGKRVEVFRIKVYSRNGRIHSIRSI